MKNTNIQPCFDIVNTNKFDLLSTYAVDRQQNPHCNLGEQFEPAHQELLKFLNRSSAVGVLKELLEHERHLQHEDEVLAEDCYNNGDGEDDVAEGDMYSSCAEKRRVIADELEFILKHLATL